MSAFHWFSSCIITVASILLLSPFEEGQMVMRLPGISVAKCTAEYHRDKNITLRVSYGRKVNVNVEEGAAMKKRCRF